MKHAREYRYRPATTMPQPPHCLLQHCRRLWCHNLIHVNLTSRGQPRRYCSTRSLAASGLRPPSVELSEGSPREACHEVDAAASAT